MANAINSLNFNDNIYTFTLPYGTCSTAADTAAKTVDVDNFSLEKGARVLVKFTVTNNASSPTLNVEGTGAKAIYYRGSAINAGVLAANRTYEFVYNGTQWDLIGDLDTNTTYGAAGTSLGFVKSGGDVTISNGIITVNDDSHNHVIDNIDGLQDALDKKALGCSMAAVTPAAAGWYRIAESNRDIGNCLGTFYITGAAPGYHTTTSLIASISYGWYPYITILNCSNYSVLAFTKARIVYHKTYNNNYAYLEVYLNPAIDTSITVNLTLGHGWKLISPNTAGSIPSGYSVVEKNIVEKTFSAEKAIFDDRVIIQTTNNSISPTNQTLVLNGVNNSDSTALAPGIGFHIGQKGWASLKFLSDGSFRFYNNNGTGYQPVYASTFYGNLSGNASTATKATQDGSGNTITSTYATKTELDTAKSSLQTSINGKANSSHTHTKSQITDFPTSMPASDVYSWAKASTKPSYSWSEITSKPSSFTPTDHTHAYLKSIGNTVANTRTQSYSQALLVGGWGNNDAGYGSTYGTSLDVSGFSTWYHRLAFHTSGEIDYWQGINTNTLTKVGRIITSKNIGSQSVNYATSAGSAASATKATQDGSGNTITSTYLKLSGGTMSGQIAFPNNSSLYPLSFSASNGGVLVDTYGNFKAASASAQTWNLMDSSGTPRFSVKWATGDTTIEGALSTKGRVITNQGDSGKRQFNTMDTLYLVNRTLYWNANSYYQHVVLLLPVPTSNNFVGTNYFEGKFMFWKTGGNMYDTVYVSLNCVYNQLYYHIHNYGQHNNWKLCVCTYGGISYYALKCPYHDNPYNQAVFYGHLNTSLNSGIIPQDIAYYNENTKAVLNSEVYNSLTENLYTTYITSVSVRALISSAGGITANQMGNLTRATTTATYADSYHLTYTCVTAADAGSLPAIDNANGILTLNTHEGNYYHQLGFVSGDGGALYRRYFYSVAPNTTQSWYKILDSGNYSSYALPLSGGTMTGPLVYSSANGNNKTSNYISAGGGYSKQSGKYGLKLLVCDQSDCQSGFGQDLTELGGGYELTIAGGAGTNGQGYISFATHPVNSTSYTRLGYFDNQGNFYASGSINATGGITALGMTLSGPLNTANGTYNKIGDDVSIGDINMAGTLGIIGQNGNTAIQLVNYGASTTTGTSATGVKWTCTGNGASTISGTTSGTFVGTLDGYSSSRFLKSLGGSNYITINVGGNANTYYPVVLDLVSDKFPMQFINISRGYYETAPSSWHTETHKGGLTLTLLWNGSRYWDGNGSGSPMYCVHKTETYTTIVAGLGNSTAGAVVWLRGGGAVYHIHSMNGTSTTARVYLEGFTDGASQTFSPTTTISNITIRWPGWSSGADSASNADKLDGYHGSASPDANTYVLRDSSNYIWTNYIHSDTVNNENPAIGQVIVTNGSDGFYRKASLSHLKSSLGNMPASYAVCHDVRGVDRAPTYYTDRAVTAWFNETGTPWNGNWFSGLTVKGWSDGYCSWQLSSYSSTGTTDDCLYYRMGTPGGAWQSWRQIPTIKTITGSGAIGTITVANNTEYRYTGVTSLGINYPSGNFECWLRITVGSSAISLSFASGTSFIGTGITSLTANTSYEISIKDKVVIIKKVG